MKCMAGQTELGSLFKEGPMRDENEIMNLIFQFAMEHDQVRAAVLNGSRVNPRIQPDQYQDYDVVYFVTDVEPFRRNPSIIDYFGKRLIVQLPEDMHDPPPVGDGSYNYLMQFADGTRIDLGFEPISHLEICLKDSLTKVLLDKDGLIRSLPSPSEQSYLPKKPTEKHFDDCCNEFWWVNPYVAKGLIRHQLTYARQALDVTVRSQLMKMVVWHAAIQTDWKVSAGQFGKYLKKHMNPEDWSSLEKTYADGRESSTWEALFQMQELFRRTGRLVAKKLGFRYPEEDDAQVSAYTYRMKLDWKEPHA
jgi:aminoglycoside 6-adenylyltransferase